MAEPVWLLPQESAVTIVGVGAVAFRESYDFVEAQVLGRDPEAMTPRALRVSHAMHHETVHYLHSITTRYLRELGHDLVYLAAHVLKAATAGTLSNSPAAKAFASKATELEHRHAVGLSCRDLLESAAAVEGYRLTTGDFSIDGYEQYLSKLGGADSPYRRAYDFSADVLKPAGAAAVLAPIVWVALQDLDPIEAFVRYVAKVHEHGGASVIADATVPELLSFFETGLDHSALLIPAEGPKAKLPTEECLAWVLDEMGEHLLIERYGPAQPKQMANRWFARRIAAWPVLGEIAARPVSIGYQGNARWAQVLLPPLLMFSAAPGGDLRGMQHGRARGDEEFVSVLAGLTGILGAAERLVLAQDDDELYNPCPQISRCRHAPANLCFRFLMPPDGPGVIPERDCLFIREVADMTGMLPDEVWANVHGR